MNVRRMLITVVAVLALAPAIVLAQMGTGQETGSGRRGGMSSGSGPTPQMQGIMQQMEGMMQQMAEMQKRMSAMTGTAQPEKQ